MRKPGLIVPNLSSQKRPVASKGWQAVVMMMCVEILDSFTCFAYVVCMVRHTYVWLM